MTRPNERSDFEQKIDRVVGITKEIIHALSPIRLVRRGLRAIATIASPVSFLIVFAAAPAFAQDGGGISIDIEVLIGLLGSLFVTVMSIVNIFVKQSKLPPFLGTALNIVSLAVGKAKPDPEANK